jgi:hypothetical protein
VTSDKRAARQALIAAPRCDEETCEIIAQNPTWLAHEPDPVFTSKLWTIAQAVCLKVPDIVVG